ncbi:MAG: hypothetical protein K2N13_09580 [Paraprevotella sp.]|nr:hypothetical protein [Paraprevotella sp.]
MQRICRYMALYFMLLSVVAYTLMGCHHHHGESICFSVHDSMANPHERCGHAAVSDGVRADVFELCSCAEAGHDTSTACRESLSSAVIVPRLRLPGPDTVYPDLPALGLGIPGAGCSVPVCPVSLYTISFRSCSVGCLEGMTSVVGLRAPPSS